MLIDDLKSIVGDKACLTDAKDLEPWLTDWRGWYTGKTPVRVSPANTDEVAAVVRRCAAERIAIVPQGGNTGMCGGAVPDDSNTQVILSLERMNRIRDVNPLGNTMELEAGVILADAQAAARKEDRLLALSLGAEGSCQIGGNLATNAGGLNVLRYGTARAQTLGLEVVLADGRVLNGLRALRKDTAGFDLKQLFIGSEGTLGIITAATLRLFPSPGDVQTVFLGVERAADAVELLAQLQTVREVKINAFELISAANLRVLQRQLPDVPLPFAIENPWYVLLDAENCDAGEALESALMDACESAGISDVLIAKNLDESNVLWRIRHAIPEAERAQGPALKHDIALPLHRLPEFFELAAERIAAIEPAAERLVFGHVGDGNLHYNVRLPDDSPHGTAVTLAVYKLVAELGGSFAAEHGIGQLKREFLPAFRSGPEYELMQLLKKSLDPDNILNPGKVFAE